MPIPDGIFFGGGATSAFWVPPPDFPGDAITDVDVRVDIDHPISSDLSISVTHGAKTISLSSHNGTGADYTGTVFDDEAVTAITAGSSPFTGSFTPETPLSGFDGLAAQGIWRINVTDNQGTFSGGGGGSPPLQTLLSWGIDYTAANCPFSMPPCDEHGTTFDHDPVVPAGSTSSVAQTIGTGAISGVQVRLGKLTGTVNKIDFTLRHDGNGGVTLTVVLGSEMANGGGIYTDTFLDDTVAGTPIASGSAPYTRSFTPSYGLGGFNSLDVNSRWTYTLRNNNGAASPAVLGRWGFRVLVAGGGCGDDDGDVLYNSNDNCPSNSNVGQQNYDGDAQGDVCDADDDNDGVADSADSCPMGLLPFQSTAPDYDGDGCKNPEDADDDADGVPDTTDACPLAIKGPGGDTDNDGCKDIEDADDDNDGVADTADNCPLAADATQADLDRDGLGDACDPDDDGDGVIDGADSCPTTPNPNRENFDGDTQGDACDADDDNDGVPDAQDAFPLDPMRSKVAISDEPKAPPVLSRLKLSPGTFAAAAKGASVAAKRKKPKVGTTITYTSDLASGTTFTVTQATRGVTKGAKCVKPARGLKGKRCTLVVTKGSFSRLDRPGKATVKFTGRLGTKTTKALVPGSYVLTIRGRNAKGAGKPVTAKFAIVKR